ncbi:2-oxoisovalerate dehydrogenase subunit alpha, mitochondrial [Plasmodium berghei]|uniref:2-oxoisovalerate dehydrogenase subunit alpha n=2 Tax=Plasmodium berghei TaxID=5821 RepID=A0A509AUB5_PLABA|nr:2-oxoisovalerate dehydrogenase subunit alpha, mitochondrial [Plasmodium berghei ANKA]CXJ12946.1 2-oxoisovalerate dehydrogenase subunit alpha, mitochondrial [Plasmodium berghei]SCM26106.1 2-oxoisovalerate dehydrogenase subunit alpha, mitochondrial [Plasmodium berghei]SCN28282.1 2-oxoisovalerate dehydrogenase subunit alpha, mitochondrial [Plasmodium berghei]SCO62480.1 2-oxoisovalerate dehydrogenase subunit alpha, mitochondrial [Plasmodium berghei]SCO64038.1 2-oxoisovalerate dehydrogenase subu|eukprot:XP_034423934.1 2-oxoisovalerate dehydrogenase subunit alpha, mitochondrial [Plasmodium berghei ANKA]
MMNTLQKFVCRNNKLLKLCSKRKICNLTKQNKFSGYKIYTDGLIHSEFSTDLKTVNEVAKLPIFRILDTNGNLLDGHTAPFEDEEVLNLYKQMVEFSIWDEIFYGIQRQGRISFYIVNDGEEGLQYGIGKALTVDDHLYCQYRETGILLSRGFTYEDILNQLFGTKYDEGKGRQMCICYTKKDLNIHSITTPLGSQLSHAAGCGYALKLDNKKAVAATFCGDGSSSEGDFYAAVNFSSVRQSQTMFICKNNLYAISTSIKDQYRGDGIAPRALSLGVESIRVDGNDLFASYLATKKMRDICVQESKPVFMEFMSYRYGHHSTSDDSSLYRPKEENDAWKKEGVHPISRLFLYLKNKNLYTDNEDQLHRKSVKEKVLKELKKYENIKRYNIVGGLFENVYHEEDWNLKEQREQFEEFFKENKNNYDTSRFEN